MAHSLPYTAVSRVIADSSGTKCYEADFYPFGGERVITGTCPQPYKFTGQERDSESGLDYFGARYYALTLARFTVPDPLMASAKPSNTQTWNRYAYVLNNPLRWIDPDGLLEETNECSEEDNCAITVKLNVIIDVNARLTEKQRETLLVSFLAEAIARYGKSDIEFDVTIKEGSFVRDSEGNVVDILGLEKGAVNVIVTGLLPNSIAPGASLEFGGSAVIGIAMNKADYSTLPHELTHVFLGDIYQEKTRFGYLLSEFANPPLETLQILGIRQDLFRWGAKWFSVPPAKEANEPKKK